VLLTRRTIRGLSNFKIGSRMGQLKDSRPLVRLGGWIGRFGAVWFEVWFGRVAGWFGGAASGFGCDGTRTCSSARFGRLVRWSGSAGRRAGSALTAPGRAAPGCFGRNRADAG
jgi:hypothetical protein